MFEGLKLTLAYKKNGIPNTVDFNNTFANNDFTAAVKIEQSGYLRLKISLTPLSQLEILKLQITVDFPFANDQRIFVNGYQSWTESREFFPDEKLKSISILSAPILKKYQLRKYGDYTFYKYPGQRGVFHGYTYSYIRSGKKFYFLGSLSERNGFTIIEEYIKQKKLVVKKECSGLWIDRSYDAFDLIWIEGTENEVFDTYFRLMNLKRTATTLQTGWTSWYNYYQNINEQIILENLANFDHTNQKIDIFQIDDGYQTAVGDWLSIDNRKFPHGMKYIADSIKAKGYKAGIWLAPFACETNSVVFREKRDWLLSDANGAPVKAGFNWSGFYSLDFYHPEVRSYLKKVFQVIFNDWGYDLVKLDFLYAVCLAPGKSQTRGQVMTEALAFLRECAGDKLILGCGVPLGPAIGMVDFCRIGPDVRLDWDNRFYVRLLANRERDSTRNAILNTIGRRQLNQRAFINDPDVFLLRNLNIKLTETQKKTLFTINRIFGGLLFTSDNPGEYDLEQLSILESSINRETINVEQVECHQNGLIEVLYTEQNRKHLALINISGSKAVLKNKQAVLFKLFLGEIGAPGAELEKIEVAPFDSRIF